MGAGSWVLVGVGVYLAVVLVAGVLAPLAERRGWISSPRLRALIRRIYRMDD